MHTTEQFKADVAKIVEAYKEHGVEAAGDVYLAVIEERDLVRWETVALRAAAYDQMIAINKQHNESQTQQEQKNES